ncbi:MAG: hypothetical protein AB8G11_16135 [Saprospiraceae bacterium]
MSKSENVITKIQNTIPNVTDFIQVENRSDFEIMDYKGQSYIIDKIATKATCDLISNPSLTVDYDKNKSFVIKQAQGINFIPIDGKDGLLGYGDSFCDCVFFDENDFCFVEFKFNAESIEIRAIRKNRKKGITQLGNTIDEFDEMVDYDFEGLNLEAYISTPITYPRESDGFEALKVQFFDDYQVELFERTEKICQ